MRTRTKIKIGVTVWIVVMSSIVIIGNTINERSNAAAILGILICGNTVDWIAHIAGVVTENVKGVRRDDKEPLGKS